MEFIIVVVSLMGLILLFVGGCTIAGMISDKTSSSRSSWGQVYGYVDDD